MEKDSEQGRWPDRLARARLRKFPTTWQAAKALHRLDPKNLPDAKALHRYWSERWETGRVHPNRTYRELIERLLDSPGLFQEPTPAPGVLSVVPVSSVRPALSSDAICPPTVADARFAPRGGWGREVRMTADETAEHAAMSGTQISDRTLEQLHDTIVSLARGYTTQPLPDVFRAAKRTRETAVTLIDHTRSPTQLSDLYLVAGQACGLLSTAAFDMGYWDAATRLADSALTYADTARHNGLRAWSLGMLAFMENWQGRPDEAVDHIDVALAIAPAGTATARLRAYEARSRALLADRDGTAQAVRAAEGAFTSDARDDLHDEIGGEFGFNTARQAVDAGSAYVTLRDGPAAEQYAQRALASYAALPPEQRVFYAVNAARVDLATARILRGDLMSARDALVPVFALPTEQRTAGLTGRLAQARVLLADPNFRNSRAARQLTTDIEQFTTDTAEHALPQGDI